MSTTNLELQIEPLPMELEGQYLNQTVLEQEIVDPSLSLHDVFANCKREITDIKEIVYQKVAEFEVTKERQSIYVIIQEKEVLTLEHLNAQTFVRQRSTPLTHLNGEITLRVSEDCQYLIAFNSHMLLFANIDQYFRTQTPLWVLDNSKSQFVVDNELTYSAISMGNQVFIGFEHISDKKKKTYILINQYQTVSTAEDFLLDPNEYNHKVVLKDQNYSPFDQYDGRIFISNDCGDNNREWHLIKEDGSLQAYFKWYKNRVYYQTGHDLSMMIFNKVDGSFRAWGFDWPENEWYHFLAYKEEESKDAVEFLFMIDFIFVYYAEDRYQIIFYDSNIQKIINIIDCKKYVMPDVLTYNNVLQRLCNRDQLIYRDDVTQQLLKIDLRTNFRTYIAQQIVMFDYFDTWQHQGKVCCDGNYMYFARSEFPNNLFYESIDIRVLQSFKVDKLKSVQKSQYIEELKVFIHHITLNNNDQQVLLYWQKLDKNDLLLTLAEDDNRENKELQLLDWDFQVNNDKELQVTIVEYDTKKMHQFKIYEDLEPQKIEKSLMEGMENLTVQVYLMDRYLITKNDTNETCNLLNFDTNKTHSLFIANLNHYVPIKVLDVEQQILFKTTNRPLQLEIFDIVKGQSMFYFPVEQIPKSILYVKGYIIVMKGDKLNIFDNQLVPQVDMKFKLIFRSGSKIIDYPVDGNSIASRRHNEGLIYIYNEDKDQTVTRLNLLNNNDRRVRNDFRHFIGYIPFANYIRYDDEVGLYTFIYKQEKEETVLYTYSAFYTDIFQDEFRKIAIQDEETIINKRKSGGVQEFLTNLYPYCSSFLHQVALKPTVLDEFMKKLILMNSKDVPYILTKDVDGNTPFDIAVKQNQRRSITLISEMVIKFQSDSIHNAAFDKWLISLIKNGIDLREYFQSNLPIQQIQNHNFPVLHVNDKVKIYGYSCDNYMEILTKKGYMDVIGKDLGDENIQSQNLEQKKEG